MPANAQASGLRPKREFKRGFWWTLGAAAAYAVVGGGIALALAYFQRGQKEPEVVAFMALREDGCVTGACSGMWAR